MTSFIEIPNRRRFRFGVDGRLNRWDPDRRSVVAQGGLVSSRSLVTGVLLLAGTLLPGTVAAGLLHAQNPLGIISDRGLTATPVYEGWYPNPDGTVTLSFGYYNRNRAETLDIEHGPDNFMEPAELDGGQPTHLRPGRHWGVFGVRVPADYEGKVIWTIKVRGGTFSIPGHLHDDWKIDALEGEATTGNRPPMLGFGGERGAGPGGIFGPELSGTVGDPLTMRVWTSDDGLQSGSVGGLGRSDVPVTLTWFEHSGPGNVTFDPVSAEIPVEGGWMETMAEFDAPGVYVLRVRANDVSGVRSAGHAQCCWSNGFVRVTIGR